MSDPCGGVERRLHEYLDRELNDAEVEQVRRHLHDCPPCLDKFALQEHLKRLVKVNCQHSAPERLRNFVAALRRRH